MCENKNTKGCMECCGPRAMKPRARSGNHKGHHPVKPVIDTRKIRSATQREKRRTGGVWPKPVREDQVVAEAAAALRGFCFQRRRSPECPKAKRVLPVKSDHRESPEGSSNATTSDETDPAVYVEGALTQDGGCVRRRVQKAGLSAMSTCWHSEGE